MKKKPLLSIHYNQDIKERDIVSEIFSLVGPGRLIKHFYPIEDRNQITLWCASDLKKIPKLLGQEGLRSAKH